MHLVVTFQDRSLFGFAERLAVLGERGRIVLAEALNAAGAELRKETVEAETAQTGLSGDTINRAQRETEANPGSLTYTIRSEGGNVRLKFFGAKEGGGGVTAHPWNKTTFYRGAFMTSGPNGHRRVSPKLNGQVYMNVAGGRWGGNIKQQRSGLFIPTEMTRDRTAQAFAAGVEVASTTIVSRLGTLMP